MKICYRVHMPDIETTHKLASFLEAKLSLKNTTEIPRPVHGPLQFQQVASARHPTKANTAKALVEPGDFPALWLGWVQSEASKPSFNTKPWASSFANFLWAPWTQTPKKSPRARLKTVETDPIFEAKNGLKFEASFGFKH